MKRLKNIKENELFFADFETSYINEEQLKIGGSETVESRRKMKERKRYANVVGIMSINDTEVTLIENGEKTMEDFINYIIAKAKALYKKTKNKNGKYKKVVVYFHNLEYDWSYIQYYICEKFGGIRQKTNNISYDELRDESGIYGGVISLNKEVKANKYVEEDGKKYQKYYSNGEEMKRYKSIDIFFYDSYKLFPMKLADMGKAIGYGKDNYDYEKVRGYNYRLTEEEKEYVKRDVEILQRFFKSVPNYSTEKMTLAGNCMAKYKQILEENPIVINGYKYTFDELFMQTKKAKKNKLTTFLQDERVNERYRYTWNELCEIYQSGYTGGITQVNEQYQGKFVINNNFINAKNIIKELKKKAIPYIKTDNKEVIIDVNSLYPSIMYTAKIPYGPPKIYTFPTEKYIKENLKDKVIFCKIIELSGEIKENKLPTIPKHRNLKQGTNELYHKTIANKTFFVNYEEFLQWKEHYNIYDYDIEECLIFDSVRGKLFKNYIDMFYEMKRTARANGDKVMEKISKLMLNSLYGKFGTNPKRKHIKSYYDGEDWLTLVNEQYYYKDENDIEIYKNMEADGDFIYPFLASAITSYARIFLINCIDRIPYDKFIYCDTDSIHFIDNDVYGLAEFIRDELISKDEMLKYSIEDKSLCSVYLAPKKYSYIDENGDLIVKCAGLPDNAKDNIKDITEFYYGYITCDKLSKQRIKGGIDLVPTLYQIKPPIDKKIIYNKIEDGIQI